MEIDPNPLGSGAYGVVYRITNFQPPAVIKYLLKRSFDDSEINYRRECEAMHNLRHKNIVQYLGAEEGLLNGEWCFGIVLEYCERGALTNVIFDRRVAYNVYTVARWAEEVFGALAFLQAKNAIHRDIKPDNILVTEDFTLKLSDFGCIDEGNGRKKKAVAGTYRYMSPEAYNLESNHKSDVYALGLVLWEIMERRRVFSEFDHDFSQFLEDLRAGRITVDVPSHNGDRIWKLIESCTMILPESRPSSTEALSKASAYRQELETTTTLDFRPVIYPDRRSLRRPYNSARVGTLSLSDSSMFEVKNVTFGSNSELVAEKQAEIPGNVICRQPLSVRSSIKPASLQSLIQPLTDELREKFFSLAPPIIAKKLDERYVFAYERSPAFDNNKTFDYGTIERRIEDVLDQEFQNQFLLYRHFFELMQQLQQPAIGSWDLLGSVNRLIKQLEGLRERYTKRFYFRCYFFTATKEEFLRFHDEAKQTFFIRRDLNQFRVLSGSWISDRCFMEAVPKQERYAQLIYDKLIDDPKMHYLREESVDLDQVIASMDRTKYRLENFAYVQAMNFVNPHIPREASAVDMLTDQYVFQLRNPPRHSCNCNPRCSIIGGFPREVPKESQLVYYACTDEKTIELLELYTTFCKKLFYLQRNYSTNFRNYDPSAIEHEDRLLETKFKEKSLNFFTFQDRSEHLLLLDHQDNYDRSEKIPCVNSQFHFYTLAYHGSFEKLFGAKQPVKIDAVELAKIRYDQDFALTFLERQNRRTTLRTRVTFVVGSALLFYQVLVWTILSNIIDDNLWLNLASFIGLIVIITLVCTLCPLVLYWRLLFFEKALTK